jgi:hypothetical protein
MGDNQGEMMTDLMEDMIGSFPGIEEALSFGELMKFVQDSDFTSEREIVLTHKIRAGFRLYQ